MPYRAADWLRLPLVGLFLFITSCKQTSDWTTPLIGVYKTTGKPTFLISRLGDKSVVFTIQDSTIPTQSFIINNLLFSYKFLVQGTYYYNKDQVGYLSIRVVHSDTAIAIKGGVTNEQNICIDTLDFTAKKQ